MKLVCFIYIYFYEKIRDSGTIFAKEARLNAASIMGVVPAVIAAFLLGLLHDFYGPLLLDSEMRENGLFILSGGIIGSLVDYILFNRNDVHLHLKLSDFKGLYFTGRSGKFLAWSYLTLPVWAFILCRLAAP